MLPESFAHEIESLAAELAGAIIDANTATEAVTQAEEHQAKIAGRVAELSAQREAITSRRAAGAKADNDGASLALITSDLDGLHPILAEAAERVAHARQDHNGHSARAETLRGQIVHIEAMAAREALIHHADDLAGKLAQTLTALDAACRQTGHTGRPVWGAPPALYQKLRALAAQRGEL